MSCLENTPVYNCIQQLQDMLCTHSHISSHIHVGNAHNSQGNSAQHVARKQAKNQARKQDRNTEIKLESNQESKL